MEDNAESSSRYKIESLRQAGNLEGALTELLQAVARPDRPAYYHHLLGPRCLLLEWAQWANGVPFDRGRFAPLLSLSGDSRGLIAPRIDVIEAIRVDHSPDKIIELLVGAVTAYERCFHFSKKDFTADTEERLEAAGAEPAFMVLIDHGSRVLFRRLAKHFGWLHPGLLLVGETWAFVNGQTKNLPADYVVETSGLLADMNDRSPDGYVPKLRLERVPGGCGAFYPHPLRSGYLATQRSFQDSLQNAWWAVYGNRGPSGPDGKGDSPRGPCDVRWSLSIVDHRFDLPLDVQVTGRSMEVALACALRAVLAGEPVDQDVVVTAIFTHPGTEDMSLAHVAGLDHKLLAPEFEPAAKRRKIHKVVVARNQPELTNSGTPDACETPIANGHVILVPAADFGAAYGRQGRWAKMTQHARGQLARRAQRILAQRCDPYIEPPLSREDPQAERGLAPIEKEELKQIVRGQLPRTRNRLVVLGDSGMGKSMFLVYCEQMIAEDTAQDEPYLPLRLGAGPEENSAKSRLEEGRPLAPLSDYDWTRSPDAVLDDLADSVLHTALPKGTDKETRRAWLRHLVKRERVVFLFDALDQTEDQLSGLPKFFRSSEIAACPAIITGRPETRRTKASFHAGIDGDLVWADPFDPPRIREFLGSLAGTLMPEYREIVGYIEQDLRNLPSDQQRIEWSRILAAQHRGEKTFVPAAEDRKLQWKDLLQVPILMHELRALAREHELEGLKNRENVYAKSLHRLIVKGLKAAIHSEDHEDWDADEVKDILRQVAWDTIHAEASASDEAAGHFTGVLRKEAFREFKKKHKGILKSLAQIDIITHGSLLEKAGDHALAWRHFSFCEYFAGAYLAALPADDRRRVVQQHVRDPRWQWIFRYALSWAEREEKPEVLLELAHALIGYGNPFVVYDAIAKDQIRLGALPRPLALERLCRWLVHCDWGYDGDYTGAWREEDANTGVPVLDSGTLDILESLFDRLYRNSRCLHPAWDLVKSSDDSRAVKIRRDFLAEFPGVYAAKSTQGEVARQLISGFVRCPKDPNDDRVPFWMGAADGEEGADEDERPQHQVIITPFELQAMPVTNVQYELFDPGHRRDQFSSEDQCPVIDVNWYMARMFCLWLGRGHRLPTEAEWECACRGLVGSDRTTRFNTGNDEADLNNAGWYWENWGKTEGRTHTVGGKAANAWGLYDMHGNVWEWCADWYGQKYYGQIAGEAAVDPTGPALGSRRVFRGGSWLYDARLCRSAYRLRSWPEYRYRNLGFRLARSPSGPVPEKAEPVT